MTPDLIISYWPAWIALLVSGLIAFNRLIDESEKFAKRFGEWGRKRHEKAAKRHTIDMQASVFANAIQEAVADARTAWEKDENEAIRALDARLGTVSRLMGEQRDELRDVRQQQEIMAEYAEYEAAWHRKTRALAVIFGDAECVPIDKIPPHMTWWAFEALYKQHQGGRHWWWPTEA